MENKLSDLFFRLMMLGSKAPSGLRRHKYMCLQTSLQHHILCSPGAKLPFDLNITSPFHSHKLTIINTHNKYIINLSNRQSIPASSFHKIFSPKPQILNANAMRTICKSTGRKNTFFRPVLLQIARAVNSAGLGQQSKNYGNSRFLHLSVCIFFLLSKNT